MLASIFSHIQCIFPKDAVISRVAYLAGLRLPLAANKESQLLNPINPIYSINPRGPKPYKPYKPYKRYKPYKPYLGSCNVIPPKRNYNGAYR